MKRIQSIASPTQMPRLPRAWRSIAALVLSLMFVPMALADQSAPTAAPATSTAPAATAPVAPDAAAPVQAMEPAAEDNSLGMAHDLSPWGMYQNADVVVKAVMIGLAIASIITWTIWISRVSSCWAPSAGCAAKSSI